MAHMKIAVSVQGFGLYIIHCKVTKIVVQEKWLATVLRVFFLVSKVDQRMSLIPGFVPGVHVGSGHRITDLLQT